VAPVGVDTRPAGRGGGEGPRHGTVRLRTSHIRAGLRRCAAGGDRPRTGRLCRYQARTRSGGVLTVLTSANAPRLTDASDAELAVLQSDRVEFRGQPIGVVVADGPEAARHAASLVRVEYDDQPHVAELRPDGWDLNSLAGQEPVEVPAG